MGKTYKNAWATINFIEHYLILASAITGCISISASAFLLGIPMGITSSAMGLKIYAIATGIKKYISIIKKRKRTMIK